MAPTGNGAGAGLTVMKNVCDVTGQPFEDGVTVIEAVTALPDVLIATKEGIVEPLPLAAKPIDGVLFVQA